MEAPRRIPYSGCPLCGAADGMEIMVADCSRHELYQPPLPPLQRWLECWSCRHVYVDGYFNTAALELLFSRTQPAQVPGHDAENQRFVWARVVDAVQALRPSVGGRWLDVGFGNGALLATAAEYGFDVVGVDTREASARAMRELGFEAYAGDFAAFRAERLFDVISMADVLEHMPFPGRALEHAHALLAGGGVLFLSMPNLDAFVWAVMTREGSNPYWAEIEHYHNFGRRRLCALLEEKGFRPLRYGVSTRYRSCMELIAQKSGDG